MKTITVTVPVRGEWTCTLDVPDTYEDIGDLMDDDLYFIESHGQLSTLTYFDFFGATDGSD